MKFRIQTDGHLVIHLGGKVVRVYEELLMAFFNTSFETVKVKMDSLEKQTKTLAQESNRLRSDSAKMNKEISDLRSSIDDQA